MGVEIKISKVRDPENIVALCAMLPRYICFDFRHSSQHYIGEIDEALLTFIPHTVRKIGTFDVESPLYMSYIAGRFSLNGVQIEGDVPVRTCEMLAAEGLEIIKVVASLTEIEKYEGVTNKFLVRDPKLLKRYNSKTPLIVDSSIYSAFAGAIVDIDSEFEDRVAYKNCKKIEDWFKNMLR